MGLNLEALRRAYFDYPPAEPLDHIPTREELIGWYERRTELACIAAGGGPGAGCLGVHSRLIGGASKPLRTMHVTFQPEHSVPIPPMPLSWFSYPEAMLSCLAQDLSPSPERGYPFTDHLLKAYAAGVVDSPTPAALARMLRAETVTDYGRAHLANVFLCAYPYDFGRFLWDEGLSIYEFARAIHHSNVRRNPLIQFLHRYASAPHL